MGLSKPKRHADRALLDTYHKKGCLACGQLSDPCHIGSRGAHRPDVEWNVMPLCRVHHTQQHKLGWKAMAFRYPKVYMFFKTHGWTFDETGRPRNDRLKDY